MVALRDPLTTAGTFDVLALLEANEQERLSAAIGGFGLRSAAGPDEFLHQLENERPRVVVVGVPPATLSTVEAVAAVRRRRLGLRCVLVNAPLAIDERLRALELGFDAALSADTPVAELGGRIAILARAGASRGTARARIPIGDGVELDLSRGCLLRDGRQVHLRPKEFHLLETLARRPGRAYTRGELLDRVWGQGHAGNPRTVEVHIRWLRAKVERDPDEPVHLVTVRGRGYRLEPEAL
jgi:DNA-binding response OmpR family regulator